ncbi:hypothetical protein AB0M20_15145 [Actinoplanes sp. NPDC051633]|uniref:DUF6197 family protein n=1 Tax=Actinoplanes sp. NPDC051633 TaxID=3155670 RepID=UPI0034291AE1
MPETITRQRPTGPLVRLAAALKARFIMSGGSAEPATANGPGNVRQQHALAVLTTTREVVRRGWTQHSWFVMTGSGEARQRFFPGRVDHSRVVEACLVGAVMHAAWQHSSRPEYGYAAIDALWLELFDGGAPEDDPVGPACPPEVRAARVRDLTAWNDRGDRTKEEVLALLDRATARSVSFGGTIAG